MGLSIIEREDFFTLMRMIEVNILNTLKPTNQAGVMTRPIWKLLFKLPMYSNCQRNDQVNAQHLENTIVNMPSSYQHEEI